MAQKIHLKRLQSVRIDPKCEVNIFLSPMPKSSNNVKNSGGGGGDDPEMKFQIFLLAIEGSAETFGAELNSGQLYPLSIGDRIIIQTLKGFTMCFLVSFTDCQDDDDDEFDLRYQMKIESKNDCSKRMTINFFPVDIHMESNGTLTREQRDSIFNSLALAKKRNESVNKKSTAKNNIHCDVNKYTSGWLYESYLKLSDDLNRQRRDASIAKPKSKPGPNVLIMGPCDSGKSTLTKILANRARQNGGWSPMLIDLDVGQGSITLPGMIAAGIVQSQCRWKDIVWKLQSTIIHHYGYTTAEQDPELFQITLESLAQDVSKQFNGDGTGKLRPSGSIINTHGWIDGFADRNVWQRIRKDLPEVKAVYFDHNGKLVKKTQTLRAQLRMERIEMFFRNQSDLVSVSIPFDNHSLYRVYSVKKFIPIPGSGRPYRLRIGRQSGQFIISRLSTETLVYLLDRLVSILQMSVEQIANGNKDMIGTLRVESFGRIINVDLELKILLIIIPKRFAELLTAKNRNFLIFAVNGIGCVKQQQK